MLKVTQRLPHSELPADRVILLPFDLRQRSRLRCSDTKGQEIALFLSRGVVLRHGDRLQAESGEIVAVEAALETVSVVTGSDAYALSRAAYHLGNRHVPLQIEPQRLAYAHDHVLDDMLRALGFSPRVEQARFEPEPGAYGGHSHRHSEGDSTADAHHHDHHH